MLREDEDDLPEWGPEDFAVPWWIIGEGGEPGPPEI